NADGFSFQILRRRNVAVGAHVNRRMAKHPRWKYRNADEGRIALRGIADEFPKRQFGNVPLAAFQKSEGDFFDRQRESRQHDAVGPHHAVAEIAHMVVVGGRERQMQPRRAAALDNFRLALRAAYFARLIDRHDVRVSQLIGGRHPTRARDPCMPPSDAVNSHQRPLRPGSGPDEDCLLKRAVLVSLALLVAGRVAAGEMESPAVTLSDVNWGAAAASSSDHGNEPAAETFARLNAITGKRFTGIAKSTVPVLLPFDVDAFRKDVADGKSDATASEKYFGGFHPTKFFLAGPAGYDATYTLSDKADGLKIDFEKPIVFEISGAAFVYDLNPPNHIEKEEPPPKDLAA